MSNRKLLIAISNLLILITVGCRPNRETTNNSTLDSAETKKTLASAQPIEKFDEFEFTLPENWKRVKPDRPVTKAVLLLNGRRNKNPDGMIKVDVGKPAFPSAEETAKQFGGSDGVSITVDGNDAILTTTSSNDFSKPRHVVVVHRNARIYLIMAAGGPGIDVKNALYEVVKSWHWIEIDKK
jgi:hypothetical protein